MVANDPFIEFAQKREAQFAESAAKEATLRGRVLQQLYGGLWHTTHPERFEAILASGAIRAEPIVRRHCQRSLPAITAPIHPCARCR